MLGFTYVVFIADSACNNVDGIACMKGVRLEDWVGCTAMWVKNKFSVFVKSVVLSVNGRSMICELGMNKYVFKISVFPIGGNSFMVGKCLVLCLQNVVIVFNVVM